MAPLHDIVVTPEHPACSVLYIHGYSGSNDGFDDLINALVTELNAQVVMPLLPGHGTTESDLLRYEHVDFLAAVRRASSACVPNVPLVCIGHCYGGYLAVTLARELSAAAVIFAVTPYPPRFPLDEPFVRWIARRRTLWKKPFTKEDIEARKGLFYYRSMPGKVSALMHEGTKILDRELPALSIPVLTLYNADDLTTNPRSGDHILARVHPHPLNRTVLFPRGRHTMFFGPYRSEAIRITVDFLRTVLPQAQ